MFRTSPKDENHRKLDYRLNNKCYKHWQTHIQNSRKIFTYLVIYEPHNLRVLTLVRATKNVSRNLPNFCVDMTLTLMTLIYILFHMAVPIGFIHIFMKFFSYIFFLSASFHKFYCFDDSCHNFDFWYIPWYIHITQTTGKKEPQWIHWQWWWWWSTFSYSTNPWSLATRSTGKGYFLTFRPFRPLTSTFAAVDGSGQTLPLDL